MHLGCTCLAQQLNDLARCRAADNRIINDDKAFAIDIAIDRIQLDADAGAALFLIRIDERTANVAILDETIAVGNAAFFRESLRSRAP